MPPVTLLDGETIAGRPLRLLGQRQDDKDDDANSSSDAIELTLLRCDYDAQLWRRVALLVLVGALYVPYLCWSRFGIMHVDGLAVGVLLVLVHRVYRLIEREKVVLAKHLALQVTTTFAFGRTVRRHLLPVEHIHDVVINEVIENLKVVYVLNVLTKGKLFETRPIIPLLLSKPRVDILEAMYKPLQSALKG